MGPDKFWWRIKVACGAALIAVLAAHYLGPGGADLVPRLLAQTLVVGGGLITLFHHRLIRRAGRNAGGAALVTRGGLFHWIRHPMYTGDLLLYTGLALLAPGIASGAFLALGAFALYKQAQVEDDYLLAHHGDLFRDWQARTRLL